MDMKLRNVQLSTNCNFKNFLFCLNNTASNSILHRFSFRLNLIFSFNYRIIVPYTQKQEMEATQLLEGALDESLPYYSAEDDENNFPKKLIGVMIIEENNEYNVFQGDTISIGRDPENCNIVLENKVIT